MPQIQLSDFDSCPRIPLKYTEPCTLVEPETVQSFSVGSIAEKGDWLIIHNVEIDCNLSYFDIYYKPCPHCHSPHIHEHRNYAGDAILQAAWVCPRVVTGYIEEYGSRTTKTCLDCILEALAIPPG